MFVMPLVIAEHVTLYHVCCLYFSLCTCSNTHILLCLNALDGFSVLKVNRENSIVSMHGFSAVDYLKQVWARSHIDFLGIIELRFLANIPEFSFLSAVI